MFLLEGVECVTSNIWLDFGGENEKIVTQPYNLTGRKAHVRYAAAREGWRTFHTI